jgi:hypothetical protein
MQNVLAQIRMWIHFVRVNKYLTQLLTEITLASVLFSYNVNSFHLSLANDELLVQLNGTNKQNIGYC